MKKLRKLCKDYKCHLDSLTVLYDENVQRKMTAIESLLSIINDNETDDFAKINDFANKLDEVKLTLSQHRDPIITRLLASMFHIITFGVISKACKGSFRFWKTHGDVLIKKTEPYCWSLIPLNAA